MTKDEINKKIQELQDKMGDIGIEIEKLGRQKSTLEADAVIKALPLFNYEFSVSSLQLYENKRNDTECWKALDAAWNRGYHAEIFLEENIKLRGDDNEYRICIEHADYRKMKCDGYETDMKMLADFAKKYNLNITYKRHEREIQQYVDSLKKKQEEMLFFKRAMSE